jgi:hypothetical protein
MLIRNVCAGECCQLRIKIGNKYRWTIVKITRLAFDKVWYEFNGAEFSVAKGFTDWHWWTIITNDSNNKEIVTSFKVGISFTSRTHGKRWCVGIDVEPCIGIQWDSFEGSLRTGK